MHNYGQKIYVEHHDSSGNSLGMAGKRVDFWDGAFQGLQVHSPYTVHPGDTLRTHCWYNTAAYTATDAVTFGAGTANEMCIGFLFYFPAQYRGHNANGEQERLAMCGHFSSRGKAATICGSLSQEPTGSFIIVGGQEDRGDRNFEDPLHFGQANKEEWTPTTTNVCAARKHYRVHFSAMLLAAASAAALVWLVLPNPPTSCSMRNLECCEAVSSSKPTRV